MKSYEFSDISIILDKEGSREFSKASYPIRYGRYSEIKTPDYIFQFNLNGEIKYIQGKCHTWPHPAEWLKRTVADDWAYYATGGYTGVYDSYGEYYLPCMTYPTNSIMGRDPFEDQAVKSAFRAGQKLLGKIKALIPGPIPQDLKDFLRLIIKNDPKALKLRSERFHDLIGESVTVLPPDARHVDYEVIPITVSAGCLYNCGFCQVKSGQKFTRRTKEDIVHQIKMLKEFFSSDLRNYNSVFLGQHDALHAGQDLIELAAVNAYETFGFKHSHLKGPRLFLFGSVDSFINAEKSLFTSLNKTPYYTYINIGLESADPITLELLKKPITAEKVNEAFAKMLHVNKAYERIEVTANFVFGENLPQSHLSTFFELAENKLDHFYSKGAIYFSPLINTGANHDKRGILRKFRALKVQSYLPTFIYLIQRL